MKHFKILFAVAFCFLVLNSCSGNEDKPNENDSFSLIGDWTNYKRSKQQINSNLPPVVTTCGTYGSGFYCDVITTFYSDGTVKTQPDGGVSTYSYIDGVYKSNGVEHPLKVISKNEFTLSSTATLQGVKYETTFFYKKK